MPLEKEIINLHLTIYFNFSRNLSLLQYCENEASSFYIQEMCECAIQIRILTRSRIFERSERLVNLYHSKQFKLNLSTIE